MKNKTIYVAILEDPEKVKKAVEGNGKMNVWKFYESSEEKISECLDKLSDEEEFNPEI